MSRTLWKRATYILSKFILVSFFAVIVGDWAHATDFGPFQGKIVDADTKLPIEGVVVLLEWQKK